MGEASPAGGAGADVRDLVVADPDVAVLRLEGASDGGDEFALAVAFDTGDAQDLALA